MKKMSIIFMNGLKRSGLLIPLGILIVALMCVCFLSGRSVFSPTSTRNIPVGVLDYDQSLLSKDMLQYMEKELSWKVVYADDYDQMTRKLLDCEVSVIIEIPEGFELGIMTSNEQDILVTVLNDYENEAFTKIYLNQYLERTRLLVKASASDEEKLKDFLKEASTNQTEITAVVGNEDSRKKEMDECGLSFMVGFFTLAGFCFTIYLSVLILEDKKNGTLKRIQISGIKPAAYIGGMALSNGVIAVAVVLGIGLMLSILGLQSNVPIWLTILLLLLFIIFCIGFNLMTALLCKKMFVAVTIGIGFISISNIMGGAYFPIEGSVFSKFSVLTPQYFIMNIVRKLGVDANYTYLTDLCVLLLMIVLIYLVDAVIYTRKEM